MIRKSYRAFSEAEIHYRGGKYTPKQASEDTFQAGITICGLELKGSLRNEHVKILMDGIAKISSYLVNTRFRLEEAKIKALIPEAFYNLYTAQALLKESGFQ